MTPASAALLLFKVSVLLGGALLVARLLRRAPAVRRHRVWSAAFAALLALPPLGMMLPAVHVRVPVWTSAVMTTPTTGRDEMVAPIDGIVPVTNETRNVQEVGSRR